MGLFKFTSKDKHGNREVRFAYIDGIPDLFKLTNEVVDVTIDNEQEKLIIKSAIVKTRIATLELNKIKDARVMSDTQITEANKSVIGRAAVGTLLLGPLGGIIGGISGTGKKEKKTTHNFIIITYTSQGEEKQIVLEIIGASIGWDKFMKDLPKDENSPFSLANKDTNTNPVEL